MTHEVKEWLVAYDIGERRRLLKVHRHLAGCALHVQKSVFLARLDGRQAQKLFEELKVLVDEGADDLRLYRLPARPGIVSLGQGTLEENGLFVP
ncbi:CRISPR-associated endonuclease Cas2 [uncultured Azohydromonas sp.]|jgi:CRISPR-associated endoribonuclease Cas2|uniref:CRISPR-associated endonuclease Cas2 n=1 Tax=uncultured Azohydromonas sp. TaxID=487342 RepID=UPI002620365C|nr:CRISPR-associated endonuclease Cas2 [uncultured Azohydromonas sp.]